MKKLMNWLKAEESGQGMVEYALILALVAVAAIVALKALGPKISALFNKASGELDGAAGGGAGAGASGSK